VREQGINLSGFLTALMPVPAAPAEVLGVAQLLPQCGFTKSSHFAFPRPGLASKSSDTLARQQYFVAVAHTPMGKRSKMRKSPALYLASAVTGLALSVLAAALPAQAQTAADAANGPGSSAAISIAIA
jgi:hypothetical protein